MQEKNLFIFNIGYIVREAPGYFRSIDIELEHLALPPDLKLKNINGTISFNRTVQGVLVNGKLSAECQLECGRCLDSFTQPLKEDFSELFAFSEKETSEEELLIPEDGKIDLLPIIREYFWLDVPINPVCIPDCWGLDPETGEKLLAEPDKDDREIDPRLSKLKDLLDKHD
ncbi:MAG: DUF177 domain-containing protein [Anaerolineales bacterium]|nr:DUF177 domain-containing protein [Anaerolineales bacterium]